MEQTVTLVSGTVGNSWSLFDDGKFGEFDKMQRHVADMTAEGWALTAVTTADNLSTPTMLFWRRP